MELVSTPSRRRALFALLYLAEGAPIGFVWWALPTLLRQDGVEVESIALLLAVVGLPWTLKLFGAPLVDLLRSLGLPLRHILVAAQLVMIATLVQAARSAGEVDISQLQSLLLFHAIAAAMQDVAIDALCIAVTPVPERGRVNGWMQFGFQLGRGAFGGGVLLWAGIGGQAAPWWALVAVLSAVLALVLITVPRSAGAAPSARPLLELARAMAAVVRLRVTWQALAFALVAAAGFEAVGALAGPFLIDRGFSVELIARGYELPKVVAMMLGGLCGGWCADRWGATRATVRLQLLFVAVVMIVAAADAGGMSGGWPILAVLVSLYFAVGAFTTASYTLLMDLTSPRLAATQFSTYMGATNACETWAVLAAAKLVPGMGYAAAFAILATVSLFGVLLVPRLHGRSA